MARFQLARVSAALRSQVNVAGRCRPASASSLRSAASRSTRMVASSIARTDVGSTSSAASPATSGSEEVEEVTTGHAPRHRLQYGQAKALVERGKDEHRRGGVQPSEIGVARRSPGTPPRPSIPSRAASARSSPRRASGRPPGPVCAPGAASRIAAESLHEPQLVLVNLLHPDVEDYRARRRDRALPELPAPGWAGARAGVP